MKRTRKTMSAGERVFKDRFDEIVLAKRPVLVMPDRRSVRVDAHHVISQNFLNMKISFFEPEDQWAIRWDPDNGIPVERPRHEQLTNAFKRLQPGELRPENIEFAQRHGWMSRLMVEAPFLRELVESDN